MKNKYRVFLIYVLLTKFAYLYAFPTKAKLLVSEIKVNFGSVICFQFYRVRKRQPLDEILKSSEIHI